MTGNLLKLGEESAIRNQHFRHYSGYLLRIADSSFKTLKMNVIPSEARDLQSTKIYPKLFKNLRNKIVLRKLS